MKKMFVYLLVLTLIFSTIIACANETKSNLEKSLAIDISEYKSADGHPLFLDTIVPETQERPENPDALPENDAGHWFDFEFPFYNIDKIDLPVSPKDGCIGKRIIILKNGDHPYHSAYNDAALRAAEVFGMDIKIMSPNWDINIQTQQVDQAINEKPDLIIYLPVDQKASEQHLRKIYKAGIPVMGSNVFPSPGGMKYLISWVGPNDFTQARELVRKVVERCNYKGGYGVLCHAPGGYAYYARRYGTIAEISKLAPEMELLDVQVPGFEAAKVKQIVSDWITRFGDKINLIITAESSGQPIGAVEACEQAGRTDIVIAGIDNSHSGMRLIQEEKVYALTWQPPEQDGSLAVKMAVDWFNGKEVPRTSFMPTEAITIENADEYLPAQW